MNNEFIQKVLLDDVLTLEEKMTIIFIQANKDKNNEITISCAELSKMLGKSKSTARKYIKGLESKGFISLDQNIGDDGGQLSNTYKMDMGRWV